jgi:hypothetical protein
VRDSTKESERATVVTARTDPGVIPGLSRLRPEPARHPRRYGADTRGCHVQTPNNRGESPVQTRVIMDEPV